MEKLCAMLLRNLKQVARAHRTYHQGFNTKPMVVNRAGGRGEVEDVIDVPRLERLADILLEQCESRFAAQVVEVCERTSAKVINAQNRMPFRKQRIG